MSEVAQSENKASQVEVKVIADSMGPDGKRLTTLQLKFQRFLLPQFNTHRVFSRSASSSRAIPTAKLLDQVRTSPAIPTEWGKNQPGMQSKELLSPEQAEKAKAVWLRIANSVADGVEELAELGVHKQIANRWLEPGMYVHDVVTSTEWDNFFELRLNHDTQPEMQEPARAMKEAMDASSPTLLCADEWHLPYIREDERNENSGYSIKDLVRMSAARCARVSYAKHDGSNPSFEEDLALYNKLVGSHPRHMSPCEHQATPDWSGELRGYYGNFNGWVQYRKLIEATGLTRTIREVSSLPFR